MFILGNETLCGTAVYKLLGNPSLVAGYLAGGKYVELSLEGAKRIVQKRMDDLYLGVQIHLGCVDVELMFRNETCYTWWNTLVDNIQVVETKEGYGIKIPSLPPKYIFEEI